MTHLSLTPRLSPRLVVGQVDSRGNVVLSAEGLRYLQSVGPQSENELEYDPANLADGAGVTTTVPCNGARTGQYAFASFEHDLQGVMLFAWVSATDIVSVRFQNESGGAVNLASGHIRVKTML